LRRRQGCDLGIGERSDYRGRQAGHLRRRQRRNLGRRQAGEAVVAMALSWWWSVPPISVAVSASAWAGQRRHLRRRQTAKLRRIEPGDLGGRHRRNGGNGQGRELRRGENRQLIGGKRRDLGRGKAGELRRGQAGDLAVVSSSICVSVRRRAGQR